MADMLGVFSLPIFQHIILPFVLIFVVVFAILQRTKLFGEDRRQIDAIVAFIFALIFVGVPSAVHVATSIIPVVTVIIVILLAFMLMWGFIGGQVAPMNKGLRIGLGITLGIAMVFIIIWATGFWGNLETFFETVPWAENILPTVVILAFVIAVFSVVLTAKPSKEEKEKK